MKKQKVLITSDEDVINDQIRFGWTVISITPQMVSTGSTQFMYSGFCFLLEKEEEEVKEN